MCKEQWKHVVRGAASANHKSIALFKHQSPGVLAFLRPKPWWRSAGDRERRALRHRRGEQTSLLRHPASQQQFRVWVLGCKNNFGQSAVAAAADFSALVFGKRRLTFNRESARRERRNTQTCGVRINKFNAQPASKKAVQSASRSVPPTPRFYLEQKLLF